MTQRALNTPVCRDCDGFATAAITTGTRQSDGTRATIRVTCLACKGTGHTAPAPATIRAAR
jgi:RNase P subunit RPR2